MNLPFTWEEWEETLHHFNGLCAYCQERKWEEYEHFIPVTKGGKTTLDNILPTCKQCNREKSNHTGIRLYAMLGDEKIEILREYLKTRQQVDKPRKIRPRRTGILLHLDSNKLRLCIKEVAQRQGISQKVLAARAHVSVQLVHRYWNNYVNLIHFDDLERIAKALGVHDKELLVNEEGR